MLRRPKRLRQRLVSGDSHRVLRRRPVGDLVRLHHRLGRRLRFPAGRKRLGMCLGCARRLRRGPCRQRRQFQKLAVHDEWVSGRWSALEPRPRRLRGGHPLCLHLVLCRWRFCTLRWPPADCNGQSHGHRQHRRHRSRRDAHRGLRRPEPRSRHFRQHRGQRAVRSHRSGSRWLLGADLPARHRQRRLHGKHDMRHFVDGRHDADDRQ